MRRIYIYMLASILALPIVSCSDDIEEVFDKSSSERIDEAISEYTTLLTSASDGWMMKYYPNPSTTFGGYSIFVKFGSDGNAIVMSDLFGTSVSAVSHYKLEQSAGVVLSFDEYNSVMHYFATPVNPDGLGSVQSGLGGDFEFRIVSASADKFVMTGKKHEATIVMNALPTGTSFADVINSLNTMESNITFASYTCTADTATYSVEPSYRTLTFTNANGDEDPITTPYVVTTEGMEFYSPIVLCGDSISGFRYVGGESNEFSSIGGSAVMHGTTD